MGKATKKLIIVCDEKTEQYANYLRQLISTNDDKDGEVVGIADGTIEAAVWLEKEYQANKATISSNEHILFVGDNKTSKSESSSMVIKFEKFGMQYGWLGKRAVMKVDNEMLEPESYDEFIEYALGYQADFEKIAMKRAKPKAIEKKDEAEVVAVQEADETAVEVKEDKKTPKHIVDKYYSIYKLQMPEITPHVCRHTYCSNMAKSGMNPKTLQYIMGHADIGVTLSTYTHLSFEDAREEMTRLCANE